MECLDLLSRQMWLVPRAAAQLPTRLPKAPVPPDMAMLWPLHDPACQAAPSGPFGIDGGVKVNI